jgi:hypothetical protein
MLTKGVDMNKSLLQAVASTLEDTQSIRNSISGVNAEELSSRTRALLRSIFAQCDTTDSILEEVLARSCSSCNQVRPLEEEETDDRDVVLSGIVR